MCDGNFEPVFISGCQNIFNILLGVEYARQLIMFGSAKQSVFLHTAHPSEMTATRRGPRAR